MEKEEPLRSQQFSRIKIPRSFENQVYDQNLQIRQTKSEFQQNLEIGQRQKKAQLIEKEKIINTPKLDITKNLLVMKRKLQNSMLEINFNSQINLQNSTSSQFSENISPFSEIIQIKKSGDSPYSQDQQFKKRSKYIMEIKKDQKSVHHENQEQNETLQIKNVQQIKKYKLYRMVTSENFFGIIIILGIIIYKILNLYLSN